MSRKLAGRRAFLGAAALLTMAAAGAASAGMASADVADPDAVGPRQAFVAYVNGRTALSTINVDCGVVTPDAPAMGHPSAGQAVAVTQAIVPFAAGVGFTGTEADRIVVGITPSITRLPPTSLSFYNQKVAISSKILVPCSGTGVVSFTPDPTSPTAVPATVKVTFVPVFTTE
ncbi:hypothetical protein J5X84_26190 [Streptosporangiaceae bacterium NEAU-GS5]|nr:hypothetical protein [Streptosporangiaceae bacterium NEAU-GS5]